jgi:hypothetical protein
MHGDYDRKSRQPDGLALPALEEDGNSVFSGSAPREHAIRTLIHEFTPRLNHIVLTFPISPLDFAHAIFSKFQEMLRSNEA